MSAVCAPADSSKPAGSPKLVPRKLKGRSRVTNTKHSLPGTDGRSPQARRFYDIIAQMVQDEGGPDRLSSTSYARSPRSAFCERRSTRRSREASR
jgi:hypothetical protein